jgi:hypothetical protein
MSKGLRPTIQVSVFEMMGHKPGDRCPDVECPGIIEEITFSWTREFFGGDAKCSHCKADWCVAEEVIGDEEPCSTWRDHKWERQQSGYFRCTKCPFEKTEAEIAIMESQP